MQWGDRMFPHVHSCFAPPLPIRWHIHVSASTVGGPGRAPYRVQGSMRDWRVRSVRLSIPSRSFHSAALATVLLVRIQHIVRFQH